MHQIVQRRRIGDQREGLGRGTTDRDALMGRHGLAEVGHCRAPHRSKAFGERQAKHAPAVPEACHHAHDLIVICVLKTTLAQLFF